MTAHGLPEVFRRLVEIEPYRRTLADADVADHQPDAATMIAFLEEVDRRHGGARAWFAGHGLPENVMDGFRSTMLDSG
jgi:hypothetical protein